MEYEVCRDREADARGLNLVVVTLRVAPAMGRLPPEATGHVRVHRKGGPTTVALVVRMITEIAGGLPQRSFHLHADGAYATALGNR